MAEHTSFEVPTVSLHVHERMDPCTVIEAVRKRRGADPQQSLFAMPKESPPLRQAIEFYKHRHNWSNRLVAGDSLLVMNSLLEKAALCGHVQTVYIDPPYGIRYGSNLQPFVGRREVTDGKDDDLTGEPEQIRAFRDTWGARHPLLPDLSAGPPAAGTRPREAWSASGLSPCQLPPPRAIAREAGRRIARRLRQHG